MHFIYLVARLYILSIPQRLKTDDMRSVMSTCKAVQCLLISFNKPIPRQHCNVAKEQRLATCDWPLEDVDK